MPCVLRGLVQQDDAFCGGRQNQSVPGSLLSIVPTRISVDSPIILRILLFVRVDASLLFYASPL